MVAKTQRIIAPVEVPECKTDSKCIVIVLEQLQECK